MNADTPRPYALFTMDEGDQFTLHINQAYALADLLFCSYRGAGDGPESQNVAEVSGLLFERLQDLCNLWEQGIKRDSEPRQEGE